MKKRPISFLAAALCLSLLCQAWAAPPDTSTAESRVVLTDAEAATFSVTVPSTLPMALKADGTVETANNAKIINNSGAPVVVSAIEVKGLNGWDILDYSTDFSSLPGGSKSLAMSINSAGTVGGTIAVNGEGFPPISALDGQNELSIVYAGKVARQGSAITATGVAEVVFTVCWDYGSGT